LGCQQLAAPFHRSDPRDRIVVASVPEIQLGQQLGWCIDEVLGPVVRRYLVCFDFWYHVPGVSGLVDNLESSTCRRKSLSVSANDLRSIAAKLLELCCRISCISST
tara:strand:+ start:487 stop:804 length:318 start_codon:yes stop_codon:yes gene_type:complete